MGRGGTIVRGRVAGIPLVLLASAAAACAPGRADQALAILDVSLATDLPPFATFRFSVAGRADARPFETPYRSHRPLHFGYYVPGPNSVVSVHVEALSSPTCPVGEGSADVGVQVGHVLPAVSVTVGPMPPTAVPDAGCAPGPDASLPGADTRDAIADARDAIADVAPDRPAADATSVDSGGAGGAGGGDAATTDARPPDATAPACLPATRTCPGASSCCAGLVCGTTSLGQVCCGNVGVACTRTDGTECCGNLECMGNRCCQPATLPCTGTECCGGLVCGTNSLGRVCCGNAGAPCSLTNGTECCGSLECIGQTCRAP